MRDGIAQKVADEGGDCHRRNSLEPREIDGFTYSPSLEEQLALVERIRNAQNYEMCSQHGLRVPLEVRRRSTDGTGVLETYYADSEHLRAWLAAATGSRIPQDFEPLAAKVRAYVAAAGTPSLVSASVRTMGYCASPRCTAATRR